MVSLSFKDHLEDETMKQFSYTQKDLTVLNTMTQQSSFNISQIFRNLRFVLHSKGKIRRFLLVHFQKAYVEKQLSIRHGTCHQCGSCCELLFTCPLLTTQGHCLVYGSCRPQSCKVFPIDQRDINEVNRCGAQCGYSFDQPENKA